MRRIAPAPALLAFASSAAGGWNVLGHGGEPMAIGAIPFVEPGVASGDRIAYCATWAASASGTNIFGGPPQCQ